MNRVYNGSCWYREFLPGPYLLVDSSQFVYALSVDGKGHPVNSFSFSLGGGYFEGKPTPMARLEATARLISRAPQMEDLLERVLEVQRNGEMQTVVGDRLAVQIQDLLKAL